MKCNPLRWLLGLMPLTILWWIGVLGTKSRVEEDLRQRTVAYFEQSQLPWAQATFNGRDALIGGRADDDSEKSRAAQQAAKVWGVRTLEDRTEVLELIKDYRWRAALGAGDVTLSGYVPNEAARKSVVESARRLLPNRKVNDQMKLARGAPEQKLWLNGTNFAMRQLASLKPGGSAGLEAAGLVIQGETDNAKSFEAVHSALSRSLPQGVSLKAENISAPRVNPYSWGANFRARQVELTGHAPSIAARDAIKSAADRSFAGAKVVDNMSIASGAPANWQAMATAAVAKLAQLKQGNAQATDQSFSIAGLSETAETAAAVRGSLRADVPTTFSIREDVRQDPAVIAAEEARKAAEAAAARRKAEEEQARRAAEARAKAEEAVRQRQAANNADQQRVVAAADDDARRKAAADAAAEAQRRKAEDDARKTAEAQRLAEQRRQAEEAARRKAEQDRTTAVAAEAKRCQAELTSAAETGTIRFRRASADVERESHRTLDTLSRILKTCPGFKVEIAGHTDNEGVPERNQMWSDRRANSVRDYLVRAGVPQDSLIAVGYGETKPRAPNDTPANMAINRRIEFSVRTK